MDLYAQKGKSIPQKILMVAVELVLIHISYLVLFGGWGAPVPRGSEVFGRALILIFNFIVFFRLGLTWFVFLERRIPFDEAISVSIAFAAYYVGFSLFAVHGSGFSLSLAVAGIVLFLVGSFFNTWAEFQRRRWKARPENKGHLYTGGLFRLTRHPNYFGDCLWVLGYALCADNGWALLVPLVLAAFFLFYNIPKLEEHLGSHYGEEFETYRKKTRSLIPFIA